MIEPEIPQELIDTGWWHSVDWADDTIFTLGGVFPRQVVMRASYQGCDVTVKADPDVALRVVLAAIREAEGGDA